jgi:hypothetical protein
MYSIGRVKGSEPFTLLTYRYGPIRTEAINLEIILASMQLLDFIGGQWHSACIRLQAFVYESVCAHSEAMIWIILHLSRCKFWCND